MVVDQHSARKELLITSLKTMYHSTPAIHMLSPPFQVESHGSVRSGRAQTLSALIRRLRNRLDLRQPAGDLARAEVNHLIGEIEIAPDVIARASRFAAEEQIL